MLPPEAPAPCGSWPVPVAVVVLMVAHTCAYGSWIVDDAGISFAYARNWVEGHGWVAQPGVPPVEGFTNFLWTLLLAATMAAGGFDPLWTPKVLGVLLGSAALLLTLRHFASAPIALRRAVAVGVVATALHPAYVLWCTSGLENPLTVCLAVVAMRHANATAIVRTPRRRDAVLAGVLAMLLAATRPDAAVFAAGFPLLVLLYSPATHGQRITIAGIAVATTLLGLLALTAWRWHTFGDVVPNTFHAKSGVTVARIAASLALCGVAAAATLLATRRTRPATWRIVAAIVAAVAFVALPGKGLVRAFGSDLGAPLQCLAYAGLGTSQMDAVTMRTTASLLVFAHLALLQFFVMPRDWMGEYRFGTTFLLLNAPLLAIGFLGAAQWLVRRGHGVVTTRLVAAAIAVLLAGHFVRRATISPETVALSFATVRTDQERIGRWLRVVAVADASILAPDLGGRLWLAGCRIHDLAGLCDARIARLSGADPAALANLVFDELRPTFLERHPAFSPHLAADARFARDYTSIHGIDNPGGWYVRRDVVRDHAMLEQLRH
jgi:hypothetical protein